MRRAVLLLMVGAGLTTLGCADEDVPKSEDVVSAGIIDVLPDGQSSVRYVQVPRAQYEVTLRAKKMLAEGRLRPAEVDIFIGSFGYMSQIDSFCNTNSMWLHHDYNQAGELLCFAKTATAGMTGISAYHFPLGDPANGAQSFTAGSSAGMFHQVSGGPGPSFTAFQVVNSTSVLNFPRLEQY
jgi:hypothetical protein